MSMASQRDSYQYRYGNPEFIEQNQGRVLRWAASGTYHLHPFHMTDLVQTIISDFEKFLLFKSFIDTDRIYDAGLLETAILINLALSPEVSWQFNNLIYFLRFFT